MSIWPGAEEAIVPAQLSFLTLYNPSLGQSDETLHDQVLYYYASKSSRTRQLRDSSHGDALQRQHEERNERLRQIGLAQGMVEFARAFSNGDNLDSVESERSRTLLHEVEPGWWILASIDLTRLQSIPDSSISSSSSSKTKPSFEYSSREVCPQPLLLQHLLRAHSVFLLHHGQSLAEIYSRVTRQKFCSALERFWNKFVREWDVLLHGNPAVAVYNGLKLAAGGELGIGVGEEDWGSGEREVLEGFIERTEGLVDIVVSRFGNAPKGPEEVSTEVVQLTVTNQDDDTKSWLASKSQPGSSDGVIFSGIGTVGRPSLRSISAWMEWLYKDGDNAYGVSNNPHSARRKKRRKYSDPDKATGRQPQDGSASRAQRPRAGVMTKDHQHNPRLREKISIPPPIVVTANSSLASASSLANRKNDKSRTRERQRSASPGKQTDALLDTETLVKYMTFGIYGSSWGIPAGRPPNNRQTSDFHQRGSSADEAPDSKRVPELRELDPDSIISPHKEYSRTTTAEAIQGAFLIGLHGDLEAEEFTEDEDNGIEAGTDRELGLDDRDWNRRVSVRTLYVERKAKELLVDTEMLIHGSENSATNNHERLRVIVYIPFVFTFLFELQTDSLSMTSFYRSLHHQLGPLQRPLLSSTSPSKVFERLWEAADPKSTTSSNSTQPIYDLVYDPANLTVHTTIPNIPEAGTFAAEGLGDSKVPWTRLEALNVHSQILNTYILTRRRLSELERTCKTSRGWWVVWMRLPRDSSSQRTKADAFREAFLIRRASDYQAPAAKKTSSMFGFGGSAGDGWGPAKLAEGIGIDTRRYIEGLLSLNR
ncbi:hypothetical protein MMC13_003920 [Lambiella insularis]|nr:hypothetical protein [Lambiella insularis]